MAMDIIWFPDTTQERRTRVRILGKTPFIRHFVVDNLDILGRGMVINLARTIIRTAEERGNSVDLGVVDVPVDEIDKTRVPSGEIYKKQRWSPRSEAPREGPQRKPPARKHLKSHKLPPKRPYHFKNREELDLDIVEQIKEATMVLDAGIVPDFESALLAVQMLHKKKTG